MDDPVQLREQVQKAIVEIITRGLEQGTISEDRAKEIANHVLQMLPENIDYPKLIEVLPKLDDNFNELTSAIVPVMREYEEKMKKVVNEKITALLVAGKLDEALNVTRDAIEAERNLA
jgi:hypothetical protein